MNQIGFTNGMYQVRVKPTQNPPEPLSAALPSVISLLVLDFDGVLTDNRVWVSETGEESVVCDRRDSRGLEMVRAEGVAAVVISRESNSVVAMRCRKLGIACMQGIDDKAAALRSLAAEREVELAQVVYIGNDLDDLECLQLAGCGVAVGDSHPEVLRKADLILTRSGGRGAVRELCELIIAARSSEHPG
jgi:YrbI family 3-deoxy-D-manno-octulosonate 8-phosphate phosphatase